MQVMSEIDVGGAERLLRLLQAVSDQRAYLLRIGHAATPSRRIVATSVLADIGPRSKSSSASVTGLRMMPRSNPISHAIAWPATHRRSAARSTARRRPEPVLARGGRRASVLPPARGRAP